MKQFLFSFLFVCSFLSASISQKEIVVVIPSYNNQKWCARNVKSVLEQKYQNYRIIYINDCSSDSTRRCVEDLLAMYCPDTSRICTFIEDPSDSIAETTEKFKAMIDEEPAFFTLVNNKVRSRQLANHYRAAHSCEGHEIVVTVDGDDWLYDDTVLQKINEVYSSKEVWMTHGKFIEHPTKATHWSQPIPPDAIAKNKFRRCRAPSHLRTYYAWLFQKIALEDLLFNGKFIPMAADMAIMFPILEMAAERHYYFSEFTYVYNNENPLNCNRQDQWLQYGLDQYIRNKTPYRRLEKADW